MWVRVLEVEIMRGRAKCFQTGVAPARVTDAGNSRGEAELASFTRTEHSSSNSHNAKSNQVVGWFDPGDARGFSDVSISYVARR